MTHTLATATLITIPLSHYCEKARWGLDRIGFAYREEPHAPLFHRLATRRHDGGAVPVLVDGDKRLIDSTDILLHADAACGGDLLYPRDARLRAEVEMLEDRFDTHLGPHTRRWGYDVLLPEAKLIRAVWSRGIPRRESIVLPLIMPIARRLVRATYRITPETAQRSLERVEGAFREVGERLSDGRRFLIGDRFTAADITFAALAAPMVFPPEGRAVYPTLDEAPAVMREMATRMRETRAGQFALRMYAEERDRRSRA